MEVVFDSVVSDPMLVDRGCFSAWIDGHAEAQAVSQRCERLRSNKPRDGAPCDEPDPDGKPIASSFEVEDEGNDNALIERLEQCVKREVGDQYAVYAFLEPSFKEPLAIPPSLSLFQIEQETRLRMIEMYYAVDVLFMREILGKKLSTKMVRKDLPALAEKTGVSLASCGRQVANLRRIFRAVYGDGEDEENIDLVQTIESEFLLPNKVATMLGRIIFLARNRLETSKKKLQFVEFDDFMQIAGILIDEWTTDTSDEFDVDFFDDLADTKTTLYSNKDLMTEYRKSARSFAAKQVLNLGSNSLIQYMIPERLDRIFSKFAVVIKGLCELAADLSKAKKLKDLFPSILDQVVHHFTNLKMESDEVKLLFLSLQESVPLDYVNASSALIQRWKRFLSVISRISVIFLPHHVTFIQQRIRLFQ